MKTRIFTFIFVVTGLLMTAQVKLGDNLTTLTNSAMLEIESTTMGLLIPRMTSTQISNITTLATGLMVYNTTLNCFSFYNGTSWNCIGSSFTTGSFTSGSILFSDGTAIAQNNSNLFWDNTNNRLGIGTNTPVAKLTIKGNGSSLPATSGSIPSAGLIARLTGGGDTVLDIGGNDYNGSWLQSTNSSNLSSNYPLILNPNGGNVNIGSVTATSKLNVGGNIGMGLYTDNFTNRWIGIGRGMLLYSGFEIENTTIGNLNYSQKVHIRTTDLTAINIPASGRRFTVAENGFVGIGTQTPVYLLQVAGTAGAISFVSTSDKRFKKDILPLKNSLEKILQLNGVTYNWDTATWKDKNFDNLNHIGFIAQEVEKILPTAVNTANDEMKSKSIAYNEFVPLLVESVKELKKEIEELKAENLRLENKMEHIIK